MNSIIVLKSLSFYSTKGLSDLQPSPPNTGAHQSQVQGSRHRQDAALSFFWIPELIFVNLCASDWM